MDWTGFVEHGFVRKSFWKSQQNQTIYLFQSYTSLVPFYRPL